MVKVQLTHSEWLVIILSMVTDIILTCIVTRNWCYEAAFPSLGFGVEERKFVGSGCHTWQNVGSASWRGNCGLLTNASTKLSEVTQQGGLTTIQRRHSTFSLIDHPQLSRNRKMSSTICCVTQELWYICLVIKIFFSWMVQTLWPDILWGRAEAEGGGERWKGGRFCNCSLRNLHQTTLQSCQYLYTDKSVRFRDISQLWLRPRWNQLAAGRVRLGGQPHIYIYLPTFGWHF